MSSVTHSAELIYTQVVKAIESQGSESGKTRVPIVITDCGQLA